MRSERLYFLFQCVFLFYFCFVFWNFCWIVDMKFFCVLYFTFILFWFLFSFYIYFFLIFFEMSLLIISKHLFSRSFKVIIYFFLLMSRWEIHMLCLVPLSWMQIISVVRPSSWASSKSSMYVSIYSVIVVFVLFLFCFL